MNDYDTKRKYYIFGAHSRAQTLSIYLRKLHPDWSIVAFLYDNDEKNPKEIDSITVIRLTCKVCSCRTSGVFYYYKESSYDL